MIATENLPKQAVRPGRAASRPDGERSRERILDAAERLMGERGYAGTGIAAVSRESGLPASSIYWFFASKKDLAVAVVERAAERFLMRLSEAVHAEGPAEERLHRMLSRGLDEVQEGMPLFLRLQTLLSLEVARSDEEIRERLRRVRDRAGGLMRHALEGLFQRHGPDRAGRLAETLWPMAMALIQGVVTAQDFDPRGLDLGRVPGDLGAALLALAEQRPQEEPA